MIKPACGPLCLVVAAALSWTTDDAKLTFVDLQPKANQKLMDDFHDGREGNNLAGLPTGEVILAEQKFKIESSCIQLDSPVLREFGKEFPERVEGIRLGKTFAKLHILHATGYGGGPNEEGSPWHVRDDTVIGNYIVHYQDKTKEVIDIVYGKDVRDWWFSETEKGVDRGKVAWKGENELSNQFGMKLRLYLSTWENPKPDLAVESIDYVSSNMTAAAPFCIAMTLEHK